MNDEIEISEQAREAARIYFDCHPDSHRWDSEVEDLASRFECYADSRVAEVDTNRRAFIAELESVLAQRDQRIAELEAAIKELEEDKERLDWMQEYKPCVGYIGGDVQINLHRYLTFRSAIDASRKQP